MQRTLHVVRAGHRATLEEQDDPILWLVQAMQGAGGDGTILLSGTAVGYGVTAQDASGLSFGTCGQSQPPRIAEDLQRMLDQGLSVHYVSEDAEERGLAPESLVPGLQAVDREKVADLMNTFDRVFAW